jgi:Ca2+-binding RTX toxin-like protein
MQKTTYRGVRTHTTSTLEALEPRKLFSAATLSGGVLRVLGDLGSANTIVVGESADGSSVDVLVHSVSPRGLERNRTWSFPKTLGINQIQVRGGFRNDMILVGQPNADLGVEALNLPTRVLSLGGNDLVTTAGGNDIVFGGAGNDAINTGDGNDWVRGELGDDAVTGGAGDDRVNAGAGNDIADGGEGNDLVRGELGNDVVTGGLGNDLLFGGWGDDLLTGNDGDDALWGGVGNDTLTGNAGNDLLGGILGANNLFGGEGSDTFYVRDLNLNPMHDYNQAEDVVNVIIRNEVVPPPV